MNKEYFESIDETLYSHTLPNGLKIRINPRPQLNSTFAAFATNYGGAWRRFKYGGNWIDTPAGVAHYLEHKMFDMPDGDNALSLLSENGADPNAFTSSGMTCYYFESTHNFNENLEMLLKFVSTPYFTDETVEKEQGIIGQEIRMTEDSPGHTVYINLMKMLYKNNPIKDAVAGTVESIAEITAETLHSCHRVFYNPSNMTLCISGNVNPEDVIKIAEEILPKEPGEIPVADFGEPESEFPYEYIKETFSEISAPQFLIGAKLKPEKEGLPLLRQKIICQLALRTAFGSSSEFYTKLYSEGLLNRDYDYEVDYSSGTSTVIIGGESPEPETILSRFSEHVQKIINSGLSESDFEQAKHASFGARLRGYEDTDSTAFSLVDGVFGNYNPFESMSILSEITKEECEHFIAEYLTKDKLALSIISPERG